MKETEKILLDNGFTRNPNTFFNSFSGEFMNIKRWSNKVTEPIDGNIIGRYEGINPTEAGFELWFSHGRLADPSVLRFPRYGTEPDFRIAFNRLMNFIEFHYMFESGLPAFIFGD